MRFPEDVPTLTDGTVTLRAHTGSDVEGVLEQMVDPDTVRWTSVPVPGSLDAARNYVEQVLPEEWRTGRSWAFAVEAGDERGRPRFCGTIELRDEGAGRAEIAYGAHPAARGRGVMERALRLLLDWGFGERRLRSVIWRSHAGNWGSRKLAWRLGFPVDGTLRGWLHQRGELRDAWVGTLLASDERAPRNPWLTPPRIEGRSVVLRPLRDEDVTRIVEACADERTQHWLPHLPQPYTRADAEHYLQTRLDLQARGEGLCWAVCRPDDDALLAVVSLFDLKAGHEGEIGYWAHPGARGRGVTTDAVSLVVRHAFVPEDDGGQGLRRVMLFSAEENAASRVVAERNGFRASGRDRSSYRLGDGSVTDAIGYDLLLEEYAGPAATG